MIRAVITDCDGVLTDGGVYVGAEGEIMKRFSIRDGMGFERLRDAGIEVGIVSGETSPALAARAAKLQIRELHLGVREKLAVIDAICHRLGCDRTNIAYIGDDVNDVVVMREVGFSGCPADALPQAKAVADHICRADGGHGAFREFAETVLERIGYDENRYDPRETTR